MGVSDRRFQVTASEPDILQSGAGMRHEAVAGIKVRTAFICIQSETRL